MPSKVGQTASTCKTDGTGVLFSEACTNQFNAAGEPNAGKPTYQYGGVLTRFVGRYNDSNTTGIKQNLGMRTLRAGKVRVAPSTRGSAPPRVYMQMGETFAAYTLDTFFTSTLSAPLVPVNTIPAPRGNQAPWGGRNPFEQIALFDGYFYPEHSASGWSVPIADQTDRLRDFDFDDRGNVYVAEDLFGWGVAKDAGEVGGKHMASLSQVIGDAGHGITPYILFVLKSANKYHAFVTGSESNKLVQFNVTTPTSPAFVVERTNSPRLYRWAKDDGTRVLALIDLSGVLKLYDYDEYVLGREPMLTVSPSATDRIIKDAAFDENGTLWAIESHKTVNRAAAGLLVRKFTRTGAAFHETTISNAYPEAFYPVSIHAQAGYVGIAGSAQGPIFDLLLYKAEGNGLRLLDTDSFFRKFYHTAPSGFAQPGSNNRVGDHYVQIFKHGGKTYLFYSVTGMGDVFELDGGGLSASVRSVPFGTPNPNAPLAQTGPFPGDPVTFRATSTATSSQVLQWIFGNPEAGGPVNIRSGTTGVDIVHQYTGLNTSTKVTTAKSVVASLSADQSVSDTVSVTLKLPTPRIALKATSELITASGFETIFGDKFVDASDGSVEGHFATWTIGPTGAPTVTKKQPDEDILVGAVLGPHTVEYSGSYGKQDSPLTITAPFVTTLAARSYTVLPFLAKIQPATRSGSIVTYDAIARHTTDPLFLSVAQWTYTWTLTKADGTPTATKTETVAVGSNLPDFPIDKAVLEAANGGKVTLRLNVASGGVPVPAFETYTTFVNVKLPAPIITLTNCTHVGKDCSISATAANPADTATWQLSWSVKRGATPVKTGTGNPLATFKLTAQGLHTATVTETVFGVEVSKDFDVAPTECGPPPTSEKLSIGASCVTDCPVGDPITFSGSVFNDTLEACDEFVWNFGDGTPEVTGQEVTHAFASAGTKTVSMTVRNSSNPTGSKVTTPIKVGAAVFDPCAAPPKPANITFTLSCVSGSTCRAGTAIIFTPKRAGGALLSCDSATWTFGDGGTSSSERPTKAFASAGTFPVSVTITNSAGSASFNQNVVILPASVTDPCNGGPSSIHITPEFAGTTSGCASNNTTTCAKNETINFDASFFGYSPQACDKYEWTFGDGTAVSTLKQAQHFYAADGTYTVKLKVFNTSKPAGATVETTLVVGPKAPAKIPPQLAFTQFPTAGAKNTPVTFTVNVTNGINSTGWSWDFGDGVKDSTSQAGIIGMSTSIQHTYTKTGTFVVSVKARNAEDVVTAETGQAAGIPGIVITDTPEYKFLLPVVVHGPGQNNSVWRTDVQIYTSDPSVSPQTPLVMNADMRDIHRPLEVFNSTFYYEDFMRVFTTSNDSGPVVITARTNFVPQIWTRTYNQTEIGTFGQFIPAIRIDAAAGSGSAFGSGKYYMAGLRHDNRFRTNLGFLNPNSQTINATVKVYDDTQTQVGQFSLQLPPFQLDQFPITAPKGVPNLSPDRPFSVQVEVPQGQWLIGYASYIDNASGDPVYIQAVRESELSLTDYNSIVVPGVGHAGEWRSDITIFNPDTQSVNVDLTYHDQTGAKIAETKSVLIRPREFLSYTDFLKQGILGNVSDSIGILRVAVSSPFPPAVYPLAFARTYNDKGTGKTFGQGISGFAVARANVKPGKPALVPGIRSNSKYYTNVGLTNVSNVPVSATVKFLDATTGAEHPIQSHTLQPNQSVVARVIMPSQLEAGSLKIEATGGNLWAFGSIVDVGTADPEYIAATPLP